MTAVEIYQLRIVVDEVVPPVWRVIEVPADFSLDWLHHVVQWAMGWEHQHPFRFYRDGVAYLEDPEMRDRDLGHELDAAEHTLHRIFGKRGRYLRYVYEADESWLHHVWLEDVFPAAPETAYPRLVDGGRKRPDHKADKPAADFDASPRPFPNARIYEPAQTPKPPLRPTRFDREVLDMLGDLADEAESLLEATDGEFRADLCRAIEDICRSEDGLPPKSAETLYAARSKGLDVDRFLLRCVEEHGDLNSRYCTAPYYAAHLLAYWKVPEAVDIFAHQLRRAPAEAEGFVDTLMRALTWSGEPGIEKLLELLDELPEPLHHRAIQRLGLEEVRDDRLFEHLAAGLDDAGPTDSMVPLLLGKYDDRRATALLLDALDREIEFLTNDTDADETLRAERADYALFLTEMLAESGVTLDENRWTTLEEIEDFYWPSPAFKKRLRRQ